MSVARLLNLTKEVIIEIDCPPRAKLILESIFKMALDSFYDRTDDEEYESQRKLDLNTIERLRSGETEHNLCLSTRRHPQKPPLQLRFSFVTPVSAAVSQPGRRFKKKRSSITVKEVKFYYDFRPDLLYLYDSKETTDTTFSHWLEQEFKPLNNASREQLLLRLIGPSEIVVIPSEFNMFHIKSCYRPDLLPNIRKGNHFPVSPKLLSSPVLNALQSAQMALYEKAITCKYPNPSLLARPLPARLVSDAADLEAAAETVADMAAGSSPSI